MQCYYCGEKLILVRVFEDDFDDDVDADVLFGSGDDSVAVQLQCTGCMAAGPMCDNADDCAEAFGMARQIITGTVDLARINRYLGREERSMTINDETGKDDEDNESEDDIANPSYYTDRGIQPMEVAKLWKLNAPLAAALKYICRAGHKPGAAYQDDLTKAARYIEMARGWTS